LSVKTWEGLWGTGSCLSLQKGEFFNPLIFKLLLKIEEQIHSGYSSESMIEMHNIEQKTLSSYSTLTPVNILVHIADSGAKDSK
jgi:hypothetical protein